MIQVYKVDISHGDSNGSNGSNVSTKYFITLEKASEYLEEQRIYFEESDECESDSDSESGNEDSKEEKEEAKDSDSEYDSDDSEGEAEEITVEFLSSLFEESSNRFRPCTVFDIWDDDEYVIATISKIFIDN